MEKTMEFNLAEMNDALLENPDLQEVGGGGPRQPEEELERPVDSETGPNM